ncbi:hypothetical protein CcCBS67573_g10237 [Chytriomyces confervae]|uniref:Homeobox domain-containing protein n=1 Tax=Chytriomyces confervae TaxID=246404 RepID=A0A507D813_9FUNG|nr:hypothetical protein CcCBS67573_g10237 [Chytriomyces confervae]
MLNREHCRTTSSAAPTESMHEAHRPSAMHETTTTHSDRHLATCPDEQQQQAHYSAHFPSMQSPIHTGHPYMSHLHHMDNNNSSSNTSISNTQTSNLLLLTDFEPTNNASPLGSAIRHNSQAYRYMHSAHPPPMQSYDATISLGGTASSSSSAASAAAAATAYYAVNGEPLDPLLIHPSMPIIPMMHMPSSSSLSSRSSRQVPQKSFSTPLSLYQFEQFLAQPSTAASAAAAPSPPASSSAAAAITTYSIPIAPLKSLDDCFPDALRESPNPPTPTNLNEKYLGAAAAGTAVGTMESAAAFVGVSTPTSFTENNTASTTTTTAAFIQQPHSLSNSSLESSPIIVKKCSTKRSRITQTALLYLIDRYNENCTPSTAQLQVYAQHLNMDVPKVRIWCVFCRFVSLDVQPQKN